MAQRDTYMYMGTYSIGKQQRLRQGCASAQSHLSICCLHTNDVEHLAKLDTSTWAFK